MKTANLKKVLNRLKQLRSADLKDFEIPALWLNKSGAAEKVNPAEFFIDRINKILENKDVKGKTAVKDDKIVYNMLVRLSSAYDHNSDGKICIETKENEFRESGTFLKSIALIPYIKSLGCNIIYLLPVTSIGEYGKKGNAGSPYSIKNPYRLDDNLSEPMLCLDTETEFKAFTEAAHIAGMKVVCEFVFRTASLDSDMALEHPEWFYWIKDEIEDKNASDSRGYGPPFFSDLQLEQIKQKIEEQDFSELPEPDKEFKEQFTAVPVKVEKINGKIRGITKDNIVCKIPSAFADWPPNDNQPPWSDVTYLRLYKSDKFNYIAYNTIRMYDRALTKTSNEVKDLWEYISNIIPSYQNKFDIDGIMLDMGHALPEKLRKDIVKKAKTNKSDFFFWEENFSLNKKSKDDGYEAVVGYLLFDEHIHWKLKQLLALLAENAHPVDFFLTPETHNTPRSAARFDNTGYSELCFALNSLLPGILFIHSGIELFEKDPVNTGLDFTPEQISSSPAESLALFSIASLNWNNPDNLVEKIKILTNIRKNYILKYRKENSNFKMIHNYDDYLLVLKFEGESDSILFIANLNSERESVYIFSPELINSKLKNLISSNELNPENGIIRLKPFEYRLILVS